MKEAEDILIEKFINKEIDEKEAIDFEHRLATDKEFSDKYRTILADHQLTEEAGRLEIKNKQEGFSNPATRSQNSGRVIPLWVKRVLPIAAILIIFLAVFQFEIFKSSLSVSEVYEINFAVYAAPSELRDTNDNSPAIWQAGVRLFRNKEYEEAIERFSDAESTVPQNMVFFYKGISAMAQGRPNYPMALQNFETVLQTDNAYQKQAKWYMSLALLKMERQQEALSILNEIVKEQSFNYKKAKKILKVKFKD